MHAPAGGEARGCRVPGPDAASCCCFYGWVVLAVSICVRIVGTSGTLRMITFVVPGMMADERLMMAPSELSTLFSAGTLGGALAAPYLGGLVDRFGSRVCMPIGCVLLALALLALSLAQGPLTLIGGFLAVRMMSLGGILQWAMVPVSHWFDQKRGRAQSYMIVGSTLSTSLALFPLWQYVIEDLGWRLAMRGAAIVVAGMALPCAVLVYHTPESQGCRPDGEAAYAAVDQEQEEEEREGLISPPASPPTPDSSRQPAAQKDSSSPKRSRSRSSSISTPQRSFTLRQTLRTPAFYLLCADVVSGCILGAGVFFHLIPVIVENGGTSIDIALSLTLPMGVMEAVASLGIGRLIDLRMPPRYIICGTNLLQFGITLAFPFVSTTPRAIAMGLTRGIYQGVSGGLRSTIIPSFYGREHMGRIQGVQSSLTMAGTALGPLLLGLGHDYWGAYSPVLIRLAVLPAVLSVLVFCFLKKPVHPAEKDRKGEEDSMYAV
jgi:MFS family permease